MRKHAPVYHDERNDVWGITRHADVMAVETDAARFSNARGIRPHGDPLPMMISMDDPAHQRRRNLVNRGFTPRRVREHAADIRRIADEILDRVCERGECDFVWDVAAPLPLFLIGEMLGFAPDAYDDLLRWSDEMIRGTTATDEAAIEKSALAGMAFRGYQLQVIADRRAAPPRHDLVSVLCHAEIDGERLDDESLVMETLLILIGGDETTRHVITCGTLALLDHPEQRDLLTRSPGLVPTAVEELLRWVSPVKNMARTVVGDVELHGQRLRDGDQVMLFYPSANRDDAVFDEPFRFDVCRHPNPHIAFGFGPHFCLGASLARLELRIMFERVLERLPDLALATDDPLPFRASNFIVGPEAMPVRFTPTRPVGHG
jgi:cytochrome P450 family 142 subfamily A polypeptide 1